MGRKKKKVDYSELTLEKIEEEVSNLFYGKGEDKTKKPKPPYCIQHPDGTWEINTGQNTIWTREGGKKLFDEALMKQGFKLLNNEQQSTVLEELETDAGKEMFEKTMRKAAEENKEAYDLRNKNFKQEDYEQQNTKE